MPICDDVELNSNLTELVSPGYERLEKRLSMVLRKVLALFVRCVPVEAFGTPFLHLKQRSRHPPQTPIPDPEFEQII